MSERPTAWLIDGMAYVFRAYYAMRPMQAPDGTPINALFGLGMTLQRLLNESSPSHIACCFDAGSCLVTSPEHCSAVGGAFQGHPSTCASVECVPPTGPMAEF